HSFEDRQRQIFESAADDLQVGCSHERSQAGRIAVAGEIDVVLDAVDGDQMLQLGAFGPVAGDDQACLQALRAGYREAGDETVELFDAGQAADPEEEWSAWIEVERALG